MNNYLLKKDKYFLGYFDMRLQQVYQLITMIKNRSITINQELAILNKFTEKLASKFEESNDGCELLKELIIIKKAFINLELPTSKKEFIKRSILLQYLIDLEKFIYIKVEFMNKFQAK